MPGTKALFDQRFDAARTALTAGDELGGAAALHSAILAARTDSGLRPELASALFHLGKLSRKVGAADESEAEALLTEALIISERLYGREHRELVPLLNELSRLHIHRSQHARAGEVLERLLTIARAQGEENADAAVALAGLALVKRKLGDDVSAEARYREALRIREKVLEPNNMVTVVTLEQLSETCAARGNFAEALSLLRRALGTREAALGPDHATVQAARSRLAELELKVSIRESGVRSRAAVLADSALKKRTLLYSFAGVAAVAIAALLMLRPRDGRGSVSAQISASPGDIPSAAPAAGAAAAGATRADSHRVRTAASRAAAPATHAEQSAREAAQPKLRLPSVDVQVGEIDVPNVMVPTISVGSSADSIGRFATERPRASDTGRTGTGERGSPPAPADEAVTAPRIIGRVPEPRFPEVLIRSGQREGQVVVRVMVNELGNVDVASMIVEQSDHELFTAAVRDILPRFHFEPARTRAPESKPVASWVTVPFRFTTKR
jgi:TonB family protein